MWKLWLIGLVTVARISSTTDLEATAPVQKCMAKTSENSSAALKLHLGADCSDAEREARAIDAAAIVGAIRQGRSIDLSGVVVTGDLNFDQLSVSATIPTVDGMSVEKGQEVRVVAGPLSLVNSKMRGSLTHRSQQGLLLFQGPVSFAGTKFEEFVDLSRSVFAQPITLSGATFLRESYFVQGQFLRGARAERTQFGLHARFHLSKFQGAALFADAKFGSLVEFLEVTFREEANFSRADFRSGTGFSGSRFQSLAEFTECRFAGDVFFTFTRFDGVADFRRATFLATADFDDAQFNAREDFSEASFAKQGQFTRTKRSKQQTPTIGGNPQFQYAVTLALLLVSAALVAYLIRSR